MPTPLTPELAELKRLYEAATKGPWFHPAMRQPWPDAAGDVRSMRAGGGKECVFDGEWKQVCQNNAFIVAAHNAFPALIALAGEAAGLRSRVAELEAETLERAAKVAFDYDKAMFRTDADVVLTEKLITARCIGNTIRSLIPPVTP